MTNFKISNNVDSEKIFLVNHSEIDKRLDPFYYIPNLVKLEEKVNEANPRKLKKFVKSIASGATPKTTESEKYYSNKDNGVPFLRVQNLSSTGLLNYDNLKYINLETHNGMLNRSKVKSGDLLIKITGVGRMAIASVVPDNFEGNINQHIVVIKTGDTEISKTIAAFLNSDIGEKLASRRSTGGTRPALDYPALLSIPIVFNKKILEIIDKAVEFKNRKETKAQELLDGIDDYLLNKLGIKLPEEDNMLKNRVFTTNLSEVSGGRLDAYYYQNIFTACNKKIKQSIYQITKLKNCLNNTLIKGRLPSEKEKGGNCKVIQINSIRSDGTINFDKLITAQDIFTKYQLLINDDILIVITGATIGKIALWKNTSDKYYLGGDIVKFQVNNRCVPNYIYSFLKTKFARTHFRRSITGATNGHLSTNDIMNLLIPLPPLSKQEEIANHISKIRKQAKALQQEAITALENTKRKIEEIIIG
ncbi:Type I restriction-modification system, specificity subunit S [hydrothermal vent metagenome]|uniref:Type I restriction-modification system, specificity subunit S n=1 Tax=hydrothermal vent metagenome TaxID=652676 RepID=A0A3B1CDN0_9ZZZZ